MIKVCWVVKDITSATSGEFFPGFYHNNNNSDNDSDGRHNDNERSKIRTSRSISVKRQEVGSTRNKAIMKKVVNLKENLHHIKKQNKRTPKGHATILFNENQYWIERESLQQKSCTLNFDKKNITLLIRNVFVLGLDSTFKKGFFLPAYQILPHSCLALAWEAVAQLYDLLLGRCIPQNH